MMIAISPHQLAEVFDSSTSAISVQSWVYSKHVNTANISDIGIIIRTQSSVDTLWYSLSLWKMFANGEFEQDNKSDLNSNVHLGNKCMNLQDTVRCTTDS